MKKLVCFASVLVATVGCSNSSSPLYFGQNTTYGAAVGGTAAAGGLPELTVGYRQANVAIVPTVIPGDVKLGKNGNESRTIFATQDQRSAVGGATDGSSDGNRTDAYSTFGSFKASTKTNGITLGVFFATGVAAQTLAEAVKEKDPN